ncbi:MAG: C25 family cysteine peptidase [bacterium]
MKKILALLIFGFFALGYPDDGAKYLIISTDALSPVVKPLAEWKHLSGMQCKVTTLSEIGGSDTSAIKNYIRNAYNNWPVRPEYVLLVGSPANLPARYYRIGWSYYSDNIYGDIDNNLYMDIPVGRFPAKTARQCSVMVAKTLAYERYPDLSDTLWIRKLTTVVRESDDQPDPDDTIYWNDARIAASNFSSCDSLSRLRGNTATDVVNSVTNGTAMVLYRGTGVGNWYQPFGVNPALTNNGMKLPIILSITCETMTLAPGESMVGEAWVKAGTPDNLKGAVAFFGNTHSLQSSDTTVRKRSTVARAFFKAVFQEEKFKLGRAMIRAKDSLYQAFGDAAEYRGFNLLGDPDLDIWTATPRLPEVHHPVTIPPEEQELTITISLDSQPFQNALVCISMEPFIYEYGYTDSSGAITFSINPSDTGRLRLIVTGHNLYPYDTIIPVAQVGINELTMLPPRPEFYASPQTFLNKTQLFWNPEYRSAEVRIFDPTGRPVRTFSSARTGIIWDGTDGSGAPCPAGVYLCRLLSQKTIPISTKILKLQ